MWQRVAAPLALVWLTAVAVIAVVQATTRFPPDHLFASSPAGVAGGRWWPLATSALVIDGAPLAQLTLAAILSVAALRFLGGPLFWLVAAAGHIGATLVAYAGVGVLWLVARGDAESVVEAPDYGISAIWMGLLGALTVRAIVVRTWSRWWVVAALPAILGIALTVPGGDELADAEHALAFAFGGAVMAWSLRRATRQEAPAPGDPASAGGDRGVRRQHHLARVALLQLDELADVLRHPRRRGLRRGIRLLGRIPVRHGDDPRAGLDQLVRPEAGPPAEDLHHPSGRFDFADDLVR